ncbi:tRNA dihydrouridine synthase DusB [Coriobacteriia bacterium Es71-Z0120]|uniref:tRNA dihydrouridine synthase DusB n=1 Tax=Parvivirga hydrogeniphila TaxID=2939460 RepID=UPI00226088F3|nr:tRNA dihydrouridine synthase DusB [Parvivirga hydrogeniphila]MCL4078070.1 tRNA dihydrouridine synthase DusB [Parvivirga hydrogeniphila]
MRPRRDLVPVLREALVVLGPMAGVTEAPFRAICKRMGAGLTYTEMVSAKGLHYNPQAAAARALLSFAPDETPVAVQLFGSEPEMMAEQAARLVERYGEAIAFIDINMGCPVGKVVRKGEGCALMRDVHRAAAIVKAVSTAVPVPVTAKFRKGWSESEANAVEFAQALEEAGAAALAVHGRTREQFYSGRADWDVIAAVKQAVGVPVIGSGDVFTADDALEMLDRTGVDAVMIARGAQGNPWIFSQARALIERGERVCGPGWLERIDLAAEHAEALVAFAGERAFTRMRKHVAWYVREMPGAARFRELVNHARSHAELMALLAEYREWIARLA